MNKSSLCPPLGTGDVSFLPTQPGLRDFHDFSVEAVRAMRLSTRI